MTETDRAVLDLRSIPAAVVNLPGQTARRQRMAELLSGLGIDHVFVDGVSGHGKKRNIAAAMRKAHGRFPEAHG